MKQYQGFLSTMNTLKTSIGELKLIVLEYRDQLKRMKVIDMDTYPIMINIKNDSGEIDDWEFDM